MRSLTSLQVLALCGMAWSGVPASAQPAAIGFPFQPAVRYDGQSIIRVTDPTPEQLVRLLELAEEPFQCGQPRPGAASSWRVTPEALAQLEAEGIAVEILTPNVQRLLDEESARLGGQVAGAMAGAENAGPFFDDYRTYSQISAQVDFYVANFPEMASRFSIGTTAQGRDIFGLRIARPGAPTDQPAIVINTLIHAREWITGAAGIYVADQLIARYGNENQATRVLDRFQFLLIPVLNPDGYEHSWTTDRLWRKNRRSNGNNSFGVDLNRNFGYRWDPPQTASTNPNDITYRGPSAFSELETRALRDFMQARPYIRAHFDVHSFSQLILSPFGSSELPPARAAEFIAWNRALVAGIARAENLIYTAGPTSLTIYPTSGGSTDWSYGVLGVPAWGMELRDTGANGFVLPASQIRPNAREVLQGFLDFADVLDQPMLITARATGTLRAGYPLVVPANSSTQAAFIEVLPTSGTLDPSSLSASVRVGRFGPDIPATITLQTNGSYRVPLPPIACGTEAFLNFSARTTDGRTVQLANTIGEGAPIRVGTSSSSILTPCPSCLTDFNRDGTRNLDDLSDFVTQYYSFVGRPPWPAFIDHSGDWTLNLDDLSDFITDFYAARCS
jgi:hypothetical protein